MSRGEECELTHLMPQDDEGPNTGKAGEVTPPITPSIMKVVPATPSSPTSNKVSSSGGGTSQASFSSKNMSKLQIGPSYTPVPGSSTRLLYVSEKLGNLSRRPSLLSDSSCRTPKDSKPSSVRMANMKKDDETTACKGESPTLVAPPNSPAPLSWQLEDSSPVVMTNSEDGRVQIQGNLNGSETSLQTTRALASEPQDSDGNTSSETLRRGEKANRERQQTIQLGSNPSTLHFSPSSGNFGSTNALSCGDQLNFIKATKSGHSVLRSVNSSAFIRSFWGSRNQKNIQHHCFISDITDVRQMEQGLLQLLEDFHSGKLRAFAKDCSMEQMQGIREQQERLARLHFDLGAQQDLYAPLSEEGIRAKHENMEKLMGSLEQLSMSIEKLQLFSKDSS